MPIQSLTSCMTLGKSYNYLNLSFLIYKMGLIMIVPLHGTLARIEEMAMEGA